MCMKIGIFVLRKLLNISFYKERYFPFFFSSLLFFVCAGVRGPPPGAFSLGGGHFSAQRQALCREGRRGSLSAHPAPLLGPSHQDVQGVGHEHCLHLHLLEHPRAAGRRVQLHGQQRRGCFLPSGSEERHVRHRAPRSLRLCRMGDGRSALVAAQEKGHTPSRAGSVTSWSA